MTQTSYMHVCETFAEFGKCRCFDDVVNAIAGNGDWYYWHDGVFTKGDGPAPPLGSKVTAGEKP